MVHSPHPVAMCSPRMHASALGQNGSSRSAVLQRGRSIKSRFLVRVAILSSYPGRSCCLCGRISRRHALDLQPAPSPARAPIVARRHALSFVVVPPVCVALQLPTDRRHPLPSNGFVCHFRPFPFTHSPLFFAGNGLASVLSARIFLLALSSVLSCWCDWQRAWCLEWAIG